MASNTDGNHPLPLSAYDRQKAASAEWAARSADTPTATQPAAGAVVTTPAVTAASNPSDIWTAARAASETAPVVIATDSSKGIWAAARAMQSEMAKASTPPSAESIWDQARAQNQ